jgi:hypothetical protein
MNDPPSEWMKNHYLRWCEICYFENTNNCKNCDINGECPYIPEFQKCVDHSLEDYLKLLTLKCLKCESFQYEFRPDGFYFKIDRQNINCYFIEDLNKDL